MTNSLPLRPNVCMLIVNSSDLLFLGERAGSPNVWQFPQGGVEEDCSLEETVLRELHEELGADQRYFKIIKKLRSEHSYEWQTPPAYAKDRFRGQIQSFWLVRFTGSDDQIDLNRYDPEFMKFKWCNSKQILELAEPIRLTGYMQPLREYEDYLLLKNEDFSSEIE